jgi:hypothetical protein
MRTLRRALPLCLAALITLYVSAAHAQVQEAAASPSYDPFFLGYETEPGMDFGGRTVASVQSLISRGAFSMSWAERHPALAPVWEFPAGAFLTVAQHEVDGHGGRAREFGLSPSYGFGFDFSGYTSTKRPPRTDVQSILLGTGGVEADGVMARRILLDSLRPEGVDGAKIPLAMMAKLDLSLYVSDVENPSRKPDKFVDQYKSGNDMAYYLVARQGARHAIRPEDVWNGVYDVNTDDPRLRETWDDIRVTALWNALDPSLFAAVYAYFREHVLHGQVRVHPPTWHVSDALALSFGTRGALGPQSVSRYLDLYGVTRKGVLNVYVRDLDSTIDRTWGAGAAIHGVRLGPALEIGVQADGWREPDALEGIYFRGDQRWNVTGTVDATFGQRWGLSAKVGTKSRGFLPGKPESKGAYVGFGATAAW